MSWWEDAMLVWIIIQLFALAHGFHDCMVELDVILKRMEQKIDKAREAVK